MLTLIIIGIILYLIKPIYMVLYILFIVGTGLVIHYSDLKEADGVVSAKLVGRTRVMREELTPSGISVSSSGSIRGYWRYRNVLGHVDVEFDVVYKEGGTRRITARENSKKYKRLMDCVERTKQVAAYKPKKAEPRKVEDSVAKAPAIVEVQKNQLTQGVYAIGKDIPAGRYDFVCVWGDGSIKKSADADLKYYNFAQWIGFNKSYSTDKCIGIACADGEYLKIDGNIIVEIQKSKEIVIDL